MKRGIWKKYVSLFCTFIMLGIFIMMPVAEVMASPSPFYHSSEEAVEMQYVPLYQKDSSHTNGWSDKVSVHDGESKKIQLKLQRGDDVTDDMQLYQHFVSMSVKNAEESIAVSVTLSGSYLLLQNGSKIDLSGDFDGTYRKTENETEINYPNVNNQSLTAEQCRNAYFCADVFVSFSSVKNVTFSDVASFQGQDAMPQTCYYGYDDNVITLADLNTTNDLTITGSDKVSDIKLVIKGDCSIGNLNVQCPVSICRQAYGTLKGKSINCTGSGSIVYDSQYNATVEKETGEGFSIQFDENKENMSVSETEEKDNKYNFSWRHRNNADYQTALANIEKNRKKQVDISVTDQKGQPIENATVKLYLKNYDYYFGQNFYTIPTNFWIAFDDFEWGQYDNSYEGDKDNTYSFDKSGVGNTNYVRDKVCANRENGIETAAQPIIYPSFSTLYSYSTEGKYDNYDKVVGYVLSEEYTPEGFSDLIRDHIREEMKSYAGAVRIWCVVNEAYYSNTFFQLIYGKDGSGYTKENIETILSEGITNGKINSDATNKDKIDYLESYLKGQDLVDPTEVGKIIAGWCQVAQDAWDATITEDCGYTSEDLILYVNDAVLPNASKQYEKQHYEYQLKLNRALSDSENYTGGKVLVKHVGSQMAIWGEDERLTPSEVLQMIDDNGDANLKTITTEFNYWVSNPESTTSDASTYGSDYYITGCSSEAEREYMYDYLYYILTAAYSDANSAGFSSTCYPHGQLGLCYRDNTISPLGEAYMDLVMGEWNTSDVVNVKNGKGVTATSLSYGTYAASVEIDGITYQREVSIHSGTENVSITVEDYGKNLEANLYSDAECGTRIKEIGKFETMEDLIAAVNTEITSQGAATESSKKFLEIKFSKDTTIKDFPDIQGLSGIIYNTDAKNLWLNLSGDRLTLPCDIYLKCNGNLTEENCLIAGENYKLYLGDVKSLQNLTVKGKTISTDKLHVIISGNEIMDADIENIDTLSINEYYGEDFANDNDRWNHLTYGNQKANLLIAGKVKNVKELNSYSGFVYMKEGSRLEVDNIGGFSASIFMPLCKAAGEVPVGIYGNGDALADGLTIRIYETLSSEDFTKTSQRHNVKEGTPLLRLYGTLADSAGGQKFGYWSQTQNQETGVYEDDWGDSACWERFFNTSVKDNCLYYGEPVEETTDDSKEDDSKDNSKENPVEKEHVWDNGTVTKQATVIEEGEILYRCKNPGCGVTKTEKIAKLPAPKNGAYLTDKKTGNTYRVYNAKKKTAEFVSVKNKKSKTVNIPEKISVDGLTYKVVKIANEAFKNNKSVTKIKISKTVTVVGKEAFRGCKKLKSITISENVTSVEKKAFYGCTALTKVTLPKKTVKIGENVFYGCKKLKTLTVKATKLTNKTVSSGAFKGIPKQTVIKVPKNKVKTYQKLFKKKGLNSKIKVKKC